MYLTSIMSTLFGPSDINYYERTISIATIFVTISIWGYDSTAMFDEAKRRKKKYLSVSLMLVLNFIVLATIIILLNLVFKWFQNIYVILLITITNLLFSTMSKMLTYAGLLKWVNISSILMTLFKLGGIMTLMYLFDTQIEWWFYGLISANIVALLFILWICRDVLFIGLCDVHLFFRRYFKYNGLGLMLVSPQLLSIISERFGRIFISYQPETDTTAAYQLAQSTALIMLSLNVGYSRYFASEFFEKTKRIGIKPYINSHIKTFIVICSIGMLACTVFWKFYIDPKYSNNFYNTSMVILACTVYILDGLIKFYLFRFTYLKAYKSLTIYMLSFFCMYAFLAFILNKSMGSVGVIVASLISNIILLLILYKNTSSEEGQ